MQRVVLTGGPGAGKSTTLEVLRSQGFETGGDAARAIIRRRKRAGLPPRPDARTFAEQVLEQELAAYRAARGSPAFFERGVVDAVGSLLAAAAIDEARAKQLLADYRYQRVFVFPPWREIYRTDAERDHTFEHAERVYEATLRLYRSHGYEPIEVPPNPGAERAAFVLDHL